MKSGKRDKDLRNSVSRKRGESGTGSQDIFDPIKYYYKNINRRVIK